MSAQAAKFMQAYQPAKPQERTPVAQVAPGSREICMLELAGAVHGPFLAPVGFDAQGLAERFVRERHAHAESQCEDYCCVFESDFVEWLLDQGVLQRAASRHVELRLPGHPYEPRHWPVCPSCAKGRGEPNWDMLKHYKEFNRVSTYRLCTACEHRFDERDEPIDPSLPMLDNDGRHTPSGCVPYSISQALDLPFEQVLQACKHRGWSEGEGLDAAQALNVIAQFGARTRKIDPRSFSLAPKPSLAQVLARLPHDRIYIVATRAHWMACVRGHLRDNANVGRQSHVQDLWEVLPSQKASS